MNTSVPRTMRQFNHNAYHPGMAEGVTRVLGKPDWLSIPSMQRQAISLRIAAALLRHVESEKLGRVLQAPYGIVLSKRLIRPDILFIARERRGIIGKANLYAPPDLIVEVLSSARREKYLGLRKSLYASLEVKEYWIVCPEMFTVEVLIWSELGFVSAGTYGKNSFLCSRLLPRLRLPLSSVFQMEDE
jgi:Uma2 family endonuclease